jgi:hypothetical protein
MINQELVIKAIHNRKPISFTLRKEGHVLGLRIGNPHAIFRHTLKNGEKKIYVDIWRTSGVITDNSKPLPDWREYVAIDLEDTNILESEPNFTPAESYKPDSDKYKEAIAKVGI